MDSVTANPHPIRREDYTPPDFRVRRLSLDFDLEPQATTVRSKIELERVRAPDALLVLDGRNLELLDVKLDGRVLTTGDYEVDSEHLRIAGVGQDAIVEVTTRINPSANTSLDGLYRSTGSFSTQCEPEGFRKITYYLDRPDVMAPMQVRLAADRTAYPVLLSNGNPIEAGELPDSRHYAVWDDPFPKSSYLFALVAGNLAKLSDSFTTASGRVVTLGIYAAPADLDKLDHAMRSLKAAMEWDERAYGREYQFDVFNIVAVADFNMGAMENTGLNIFNTKFVLASPDTATDGDYTSVEGVIGHEYFHNWSGNRVTCRDWFQLSLKEGLTVFRDQQFSAECSGEAVRRIGDVDRLRRAQFPEDSGPMAHPVRPDSYIEINNFYTPTVYEKGAEVVRMIRTLLGPARFRAGMDLYFARHDGQAVTCDDFAAAMEDASGVDLGQFRLWYSQSGTPLITAGGDYDAAARRYRLTLSQATLPTPGQPDKAPLHIPVALALLGPDGKTRCPSARGWRHRNGAGVEGSERHLHLRRYPRSARAVPIARLLCAGEVGERSAAGRSRLSAGVRQRPGGALGRRAGVGDPRHAGQCRGWRRCRRVDADAGRRGRPDAERHRARSRSRRHNADLSRRRRFGRTCQPGRCRPAGRRGRRYSGGIGQRASRDLARRLCAHRARQCRNRNSIFRRRRWGGARCIMRRCDC